VLHQSWKREPCYGLTPFLTPFFLFFFSSFRDGACRRSSRPVSAGRSCSIFFAEENWKTGEELSVRVHS
jgi:hypothetical protein